MSSYLYKNVDLHYCKGQGVSLLISFPTKPLANWVRGSCLTP